jgi:hypothetical protein
MASNVVAPLFAASGEAEKAIYAVLKAFNVEKVQEGEFIFRGKEDQQFDDFSIKVTVKYNTEKIRP